MKFLLWMLLAAAVAANVFFSLVLRDGAPRMVCNVLSGLVVLGCLGGLWLLRDPGGGRGRAGR